MAGRRARHARSRRAGELAQHFLRSETLAGALIRDAHVRQDELVVEIGAGSGRLTRELAKHARFVRAIEVDPVWAQRLRARVTAPNVEVVEADALEVPLPSEAFRVVANIPFNRTTAIMRRLLDDVRDR